MYIVLLQTGIFCRCLSPIRSMVSLSSGISLLTLCLNDLYFGGRRVLKSPTTTVLGSICDFKSFCMLNEVGCNDIGCI
jgi:hypothetical protein